MIAMGHRGHRRRRTAIDQALGLAAGACTAGTILLAVQAALVALRTPRLAPPPRSAHDFPSGGLLVCRRADGAVDDEEIDVEEDEEKKEDDAPPSTAKGDRDCGGEDFNLVLVGDSPVEGIGNDRHADALGGRTARALSRVLDGRRPVRYWSYGRSGLTAAGIEREMVPHLRRVAASRRVDAVVVVCGVNNVLSGHSAAAFGDEVRCLLRSVRRAVGGGDGCRVVILGLPDFSRLPFLPYPLSAVSGWRGRALQAAMEDVVREMREEYKGGEKIVLGPVPEVEDVLCSVVPVESGRRGGAEGTDGPHPLLDHLEHDRERLSSLRIEDFFADDGFHPARRGMTLLGTLIARKYAEDVSLNHS